MSQDPPEPTGTENDRQAVEMGPALSFKSHSFCRLLKLASGIGSKTSCRTVLHLLVIQVEALRRFPTRITLLLRARHPVCLNQRSKAFCGEPEGFGEQIRR